MTALAPLTLPPLTPPRPPRRARARTPWPSPTRLSPPAAAARRPTRLPRPTAASPPTAVAGAPGRSSSPERSGQLFLRGADEGPRHRHSAQERPPHPPPPRRAYRLARSRSRPLAPLLPHRAAAPTPPLGHRSDVDLRGLTTLPPPPHRHRRTAAPAAAATPPNPASSQPLPRNRASTTHNGPDCSVTTACLLFLRRRTLAGFLGGTYSFFRGDDDLDPPQAPESGAR